MAYRLSYINESDNCKSCGPSHPSSDEQTLHRTGRFNFTKISLGVRHTTPIRGKKFSRFGIFFRQGRGGALTRISPFTPLFTGKLTSSGTFPKLAGLFFSLDPWAGCRLLIRCGASLHRTFRRATGPILNIPHEDRATAGADSSACGTSVAGRGRGLHLLRSPSPFRFNMQWITNVF